jgi:hypothetical protein
MNPKPCAIALALLCAATPAQGADGVSRIPGPTAGGAAYVSADLGGGCTIGIEFERAATGPALVFFRKTPECDRQFPGKMPVAAATRDLLTAAQHDGQDIRGIARVDPTAILQRDWVQNFIDCYAGTDVEVDTPLAAVRLKDCDIAPELSGPFSEIGVTLRFENGQEPFGFDCEKLDGYKDYLDRAWLEKYRNRHCKLNIPTNWWFNASPQ